jgi:hypothetical protein
MNSSTTWSNLPFDQKTKPKSTRTPQNFAEALKSIGGYTVQSAKRDLIGPTVKDIVNTFTGGPTTNQSLENNRSADSWNNEWLRQKEIDAEVERRRRHQEVLATPVYDRHAEETKAQINALRQELKALAKELGTLANSTAKAIDEEIENPGTYHVNFFVKLKKFIIMLRQQVADSKNWLDVSYARKSAKNYYWGAGVGKSGTKYMLSSERYMATSAG